MRGPALLAVLALACAAAHGEPDAALLGEAQGYPLGTPTTLMQQRYRVGSWSAPGGFNASLRDWGRLGLLLARDGRAGDGQVVPRDYLLDATDAARQPDAFRPGRATPANGYGYQFWLHPNRERSFALQGVYGQGVFVQPASGIVMVVTSVWQQASAQQDPAPGQERNALWRGVLRSLGGTTD